MYEAQTWWASQPTAARWVTLQKASASGIKCQGLAKGSGPIKAIHGANPGRTGSLGQGSTVVIFEQAQRYGRGHRGIKDRQRVSCHKQEPQSMARGASTYPRNERVSKVNTVDLHKPRLQNKEVFMNVLVGHEVSFMANDK